MDNTEDQDVAQCFNRALSNKRLEFSDRDRRVRRPRGVFLIRPVACVKARSLTIEIVELPIVGSALTIGVARWPFPHEYSNGFGATEFSWGLVQQNLRSSCLQVSANCVTVDLPEQIVFKAGDLIHVENSPDTGEAIVSLTRNGQEMIGHKFDLPVEEGCEYVLGATLSEGALLEVRTPTVVYVVHSEAFDNGKFVLECVNLAGNIVFTTTMDATTPVSQLRQWLTRESLGVTNVFMLPNGEMLAGIDEGKLLVEVLLAGQ